MLNNTLENGKVLYDGQDTNQINPNDLLNYTNYNTKPSKSIYNVYVNNKYKLIEFDMESVEDDSMYEKFLNDNKTYDSFIKEQIELLKNQGAIFVKSDVIEEPTKELSLKDIHFNLKDCDINGNIIIKRTNNNIEVTNGKAKIIIDYFKTNNIQVRQILLDKGVITFDCPLCNKNNEKMFIYINSFHIGTHSQSDCTDKEHQNKYDKWKKDLKKLWKNSKDKKDEDIREYIEQIKNQGAKIDNDKDVNWIYYDDNSTIKINTGLLAEYLRGKLHYIFIRNDATEGIQRYVYNNGVYGIINDDEFKYHIKKYIPLEIRKSIQVNEVLKELYTDNKFLSYNDINPENYINFKDGLLNINTWELEPHTSKVLSTIQLPLCYPKDNPKNNGVFDNYLNYLVSGDEDIKKLVAQFMGIVISNIQGHRMKKALFMVGTHNTGKSKIKELLIKLIGEQNANTLDLETLEARFGSSQILNKRLVGSNDMSYMKVKELKIFKMITGGDTIFMESKGKDGFNSKFQGVAWFCCNELPKFSGDKEDGVYNRFVIVKCNDKAIPESKQNKRLLEDMFEEREYILTLALRGLKEVINNNYTYDIPDKCKEHLEAYKIENDSFLKFFNECTEPRTGKFDGISKSLTYKIYVEWCKDNNNGYKQNKNECQRLLEKIKMDEVKKTDGIRYYSKFTINKDTKSEYDLKFLPVLGGLM